MSRRGVTLAVASALAVGLGVVGTQLSVPYVGLGPGPVTNTLGEVSGEPLITIEGTDTFPASGHLDLTTVNVYPRLDLATALRYWFDDSLAIVPREIIYPKDQTPAEAEQETKREMEESQDHAITAALRELHVQVVVMVVVERVEPGSPAATAGIRADDVLVAVDGKKIESIPNLRTLLATRRPGQTARIDVRRGTDVRTLTVGTTASPDGENRPTIGVVLREAKRYPFQVKIRLDDVGGPSAGLMFALGIIDRLTPGELTGGVHIAGTGTIDDNGMVGAIGGIQQKLIAAREAGATVFLTPADNYPEAARAVPKGLTLVKVSSLTEALAAVNRIATAA